MRPFESLTRRGQARRLRDLALVVLRQYDLDVARLELLGAFTNTLFRVRCPTGASYVLRIGKPGWRTDADILSEVAWLDALADEPGIGAPVVQRTREGEALIQVAVEGVPEPRRCLLMSWLPGISLEKRLTEPNLERMGALFARLHAQAADFIPPRGFTQRRMSHYLARDEVDALFSVECLESIEAGRRDVLLETRRRVEDAFRGLYADLSGLRVIHNDLWHGNIKVYRGRLHPLDFEDTIWGYPVQDLAMALQDLMSDVAPEQYAPHAAALRRGYERHSTWPEAFEGQIDLFRAGRMLWVANYVACFERQYLGDHLGWVTPMLERFLQSGRLRKAVSAA